ncbi:MAG TPA: hypothetical protein VHG91_19385 [Longimicrobium sp.]|nr:hypothetical protein [Longimicrobium sp.]
MKKSTAIRLTLAYTFALGAAACGREEEGPTQAQRGWCDPDDETQCATEPRSGYVPVFYPIWFGGYYYDSRGVARTGPGGAVVRNAPRSSVTRGGFGRIGGSRTGAGGRAVGA